MPGHQRILSRCLVLVDFQEIRHLRCFAAKTSRLVMLCHERTQLRIIEQNLRPFTTVCLQGLEIC